jgi:hypothetical protein
MIMHRPAKYDKETEEGTSVTFSWGAGQFDCKKSGNRINRRCKVATRREKKHSMKTERSVKDYKEKNVLVPKESGK